MEKLHQKQKLCTCENPNEPNDWLENSLWIDHHQQMVQQAVSAAAASSERTADDLDLVILGDSITERINGTRHQGNVMLPENRAVFESFFTKAGGGKVNALALGSSGDTSPNLLWHLENGILPETLNPKVWLVLIGTNNLGRTFCSKEATLDGILAVVTTLQSKKPDASILLHGLLPRSDDSMAKVMMDENYKLGYYWEQIQWINQRLKQWCRNNNGVGGVTNTAGRHCDYMETIDIFLSSTGEDDDGMMINRETMTDALHPSHKGIEKWGPLIVEKVQSLL